MPSGKRETERKGNAPVNTGPSPNSDGRANNLVDEADEAARGSGPLQMTQIKIVRNQVAQLLHVSVKCSIHNQMLNAIRNDFRSSVDKFHT
ncbi:hypothetical protein T07_4031 [Trichinella nelsoni]|uniref:Uncharacterized protein n=1 Tax=Trichinella nelsoni TaxID=6336 RepID=A0A0V0SMT9_9BILA|nr:hypothetical protein T07_1267 [Trichinella nelsoni]KRX28192.1 hypothetical protein T07_4031 [Trichinella nelsoni]